MKHDVICWYCAACGGALEDSSGFRMAKVRFRFGPELCDVSEATVPICIACARAADEVFEKEQKCLNSK